MTLTPDDGVRLTRYYDLLDRYQNLDTDRMMSLLAVRLLCLKHGYAGVVEAVRSLGEDKVVLAAKEQLKEMAQTWMRMMDVNPPPAEIFNEVRDNVDTVRKAYFDVNVSARLYKQLIRMRIREDWLKQRDRVASSKLQQ